METRPQFTSSTGNISCDGWPASWWIVSLPIGEPDPAKQVAAIRHATQAMKDSRQADAIDLVVAVHEWLPIDIQALSRGTQNMFVTNVPGPQFPLYTNGARMEGIYPISAIVDGVGLNMTLMSYNGNLDFGLVADREMVPDIWRLIDYLGEELETLAPHCDLGLADSEFNRLELEALTDAVVERNT